jgi:hypothetical protein
MVLDINCIIDVLEKSGAEMEPDNVFTNVME